MSNEELNEILEELHKVRPEKLNDKAKRLFEAIMKIATQRDKAEADLYEVNNRINDLLDIVKQKDEMINKMAKTMYLELPVEWYHMWNIKPQTKEQIIKYFEERCK